LTPFGFIVHPLSPKDVTRKYRWAGVLPDSLIEIFLERMSPVMMSHVPEVRSATGATTKGWFVGCPLTPRMMVDKLPIETVYAKIVEAVTVAANEGAQLVGLGAFTSVVGDGGLTIQHQAPVPVTTGNSYTVATAIDALVAACDAIEIDRRQAVLAVVGATGSIGKTCAQALAPQFGQTYLIGRDLERTQQLAQGVSGAIATTDFAALNEADAIVSVTSSDTAVIMPHHLKPGSVICDVARPRDVSLLVSKERGDVLVIEGGVVEVPGRPDMGVDFRFPKGLVYACMAETMILALEDRPECFTIGKDVTLAQVEEISALAKKHGFKLAGFRSFERPVTDETLARVRAARKHLAPV
jgi:predicted amino acid dehydrogenase